MNLDLTAAVGAAGAALAAGHSRPCATGQYVDGAQCTCWRYTSAPGPSPMMRALDVATRLVAQAEADGIEIGEVVLSPISGVRIHATDPALTAALAVALGLTTRTVYPDVPEISAVEFFDGEIYAVRVSTHGPIPACEATR